MARPARLCRFPAPSRMKARLRRFGAPFPRRTGPCGAGVSAAGSLGFRGSRGRRGMRVDSGARSAPSGRGKGGRGSGGTGEPGFGGFPGSPGSLAGFRVRQVRRGMRGRCCAFSTAIGATGCVVMGRQEWGPGGKPGTGPWFAGPGGSGCSPSDFQPPFPLLLFCLQSRAVVFPTSPSCSLRGREVGNTEAARPLHIPPGSRGNRAGNAAHSARTRGRRAVRTVCGRCPGVCVVVAGLARLPCGPDLAAHRSGARL